MGVAELLAGTGSVTEIQVQKRCVRGSHLGVRSGVDKASPEREMGKNAMRLFDPSPGNDSLPLTQKGIRWSFQSESPPPVTSMPHPRPSPGGRAANAKRTPFHVVLLCPPLSRPEHHSHGKGRQLRMTPYVERPSPGRAIPLQETEAAVHGTTIIDDTSYRTSIRKRHIFLRSPSLQKVCVSFHASSKQSVSRGQNWRRVGLHERQTTPYTSASSRRSIRQQIASPRGRPTRRRATPACIPQNCSTTNGGPH